MQSVKVGKNFRINVLSRDNRSLLNGMDRVEGRDWGLLGLWFYSYSEIKYQLQGGRINTQLYLGYPKDC